MKALILAAGIGSRMRPLSDWLPKPLLPILTQPNLDHLLRWVARVGIREVGINLHHHAQKIRDLVGDGSAWGLRVEMREEEGLLQYGTLALFEDFLGEEPTLILNGDVVMDLDGHALLQAHRERQAMATLVAVPRPDYLRPVYWDKEQRLLGLRGGPPSGRGGVEIGTYAGLQILEAEARRLGAPEPRRINMAADFYPRLLEKGVPVYVFLHRGYWADLNTPADYWRVHVELLSSPVPHYFQPFLPLGLGFWASPEAVLTEGVDIRPPVVIGARSRVAEPVTLGPYAIVGKDCFVPSGVVLEHALLWEGVSLPEGRPLRQTILTPYGSLPLPSLSGEEIGW